MLPGPGPAGGAGGARPAHPGDGGREERQHGGLRPHLSPAPSPRHIPQRAQLLSRAEGQRLLKVKLRRSPHISVSRFYSCFEAVESCFTQGVLGSTMLTTLVFVVTAQGDLQVSCKA